MQNDKQSSQSRKADYNLTMIRSIGINNFELQLVWGKVYNEDIFQ